MKLIIDMHEEQYDFIKQGMPIDKVVQFPALMESICEHITNGIPLDSVKEKILEFLKCPEYETCDWKNCFDCNKSRCINLNNVDRLMSVIEADKKAEE